MNTYEIIINFPLDVFPIKKYRITAENTYDAQMTLIKFIINKLNQPFEILDIIKIWLL